MGDVADGGLGADLGELTRLVAAVTEDDEQLVPPPPRIWEAIEGVVAADGSMAPDVEPRTPPWRRDPGFVVEYRITADDRIAAVGGGWAEFAAENFAPELIDPSSRSTLWDQIDHDETRELWQLVVQRVRAGGRTAVLTFRCDAPSARRWFEMTITPEPDGGVGFRSSLLFEEDRTPVALLDPSVDRDDDASPIEVCSWCGRGHHESEWLDVEGLVSAARLLEREAPPPITHGICGACRAAMSAESLVGTTEDG